MNLFKSLKDIQYEIELNDLKLKIRDLESENLKLKNQLRLQIPKDMPAFLQEQAV